MPAQTPYQPQPYQPAQAPYASPAASPFPGNVTYPPYPNYQDTGYTQLEFDSNKIADARLIRTFPLSQPDMNALEIQFRGGMALFSAQRYYEAFEAFMRQTSFPGNYLSPYWAGVCALKIGDASTAVNLFNNSLSINPYYEPARNALVAAQRPIPAQPRQNAQPAKRTRRK
jgi:tetratricopeptide (TPR) repeat protein